MLLTQVPGHQVGIVEILHAQSNDVDEFLDDLHELHRPRIYLNMGRKEMGKKTLLMSRQPEIRIRGSQTPFKS